MASSSLISTVNGYENYIQVHGVDEQVIDAMEEARRISRDSEVQGYTNMDELRKALEE